MMLRTRTNTIAAPLGMLLMLGLASGCLPRRGTMPERTWRQGESRHSCSPEDTRRPYVGGWSERRREDLQAALERPGAVVVSALGCRLEPLPQCQAPGEYKSAGPGQGAAKQAAKDGNGSALRRTKVRGRDVFTTGRLQLDRGSVSALDLVGDCDDATHVVAGATLGMPAQDTTASDGPLALELTRLTLGDYSLNGIWGGVARQPHGPYEVYDMVSTLQQEGKRVTGSTEMSTIDGEYWGLMHFEGRLEGNVLFFADAYIVEDNTPWWLDWCTRSGYVVIDPRQQTMSGLWRDGLCQPGSQELRRVDEASPPPHKRNEAMRLATEVAR